MAEKTVAEKIQEAIDYIDDIGGMDKKSKSRFPYLESRSSRIFGVLGQLATKENPVGVGVLVAATNVGITNMNGSLNIIAMALMVLNNGVSIKRTRNNREEYKYWIEVA